MGCDIHMAVEVLKDGIWTAHGAKTETAYGDPYLSWDEPNTGRSYDLFAILANVRNGHGFAGIKTGEGFNPISEPRGIPSDASPEYREWAGEMGGDGHSHSYFTVAELLAYDWTQTTGHQGYVNLKGFAETLARGKPSSWSGDISGGGIVKLPFEGVKAAWERVKREDRYPWQEPQQARLAHALGHPADRIHTLVHWTEPYYVSVSGFLSETLPVLWRLGDPASVRICFFFDN